MAYQTVPSVGSPSSKECKNPAAWEASPSLPSDGILTY
jgi:hypothetical protein